MPSSNELVFSGLYLPRPLELTSAITFLSRLAADRAAPRLVFEARADANGVRHLLGCRQSDVHGLRRLLADLLPGSALTAPGPDQHSARPAVRRVCRLRFRPRSMPLATDRAEATTRSLLSALVGAVKRGEAAVVQIVLGPRHAPRLVQAKVPAPDTTLLDALTVGVRPATREVRNRLQERLSHDRFAATIRLGTASPDSDRQQRLLIGLLSAISTAQAAGVNIHLVREPAATLNEARLPWYWPLRLTAPELVGLLGWPLGDTDLPGLPPMHPKPLRAAASVHSGPRVFAVSAAPGDHRRLGIAPADALFHAVAYGPSGSGKTTVFEHLIRADIAAGLPVAVLDPKKQLIDMVLGFIPKDRFNDVVILDASEQHPIGFNPLDVTGRDPDVVVDGILSVFASVFRDGWGPRTQDIFSAALRTLARASTPKQPATLLDLPSLLTDGTFRRQQVGRVSGDIGLAGFWSWYESQSPGAQSAAIAAPLNKLRQFLLRPALVRMLGGGTFRLRDTFRDNKILLVPLNEGLIGPGVADLLGSLVLADLWLAAQERADEPDVSKRPGLVYVDEAPRFLNLPVSLADALAVSRSLGVGWMLAAQFRNQFPPALRQAVDMNARSKIQWATEFEDARDTARLTRDLSTEDFLALPKYHAYVNLVTNGHPSGWALVRTLPPPRAITDPKVVRAAARANHAPRPTNPPDRPAQQPTPATPPPSTTPPPPPEVIGRKRRQR
jgi:type IV secretory system conjugative DNA transfer VirD4/TraG family protein